jgi:DDE superfamily endonuclease
VPYEAPQGRRVNVVGALAPFAAPGPRLVWESRQAGQSRYDGAAHLRFVREIVAGLPAVLPEGLCRARRCVVVVDNYSVHHAKVVQAEVPALARAGVEFFFLPPYSPELDLIEPVWRQVKYQELPERSHATGALLQAAVEGAMTSYAGRLAGLRSN